MSGKNTIAAFFGGLFSGKIMSHIPDESPSSADGRDHDLSHQFNQEIERYQLEVQRFNAIQQHHREIQDKQDKIMADVNY
ncbi:hypothetical protein D081_1455 [Anaerovibrio sp. JC8]|uniref:hypothetical protein n=1 Tax=Anaerovibrio sp. JC8 TaxID=1240085 RepID=UPI000A0C4DF2|nr:hypothetical protein [Anaerovibrio sp. JC8]ORT99874.1 hypothetical protein D081_1455 [Anaerovibrio sp. JC8]